MTVESGRWWNKRILLPFPFLHTHPYSAVVRGKILFRASKTDLNSQTFIPFLGDSPATLTRTVPHDKHSTRTYAHLTSSPSRPLFVIIIFICLVVFFLFIFFCFTFYSPHHISHPVGPRGDVYYFFFFLPFRYTVADARFDRIVCGFCLYAGIWYREEGDKYILNTGCSAPGNRFPAQSLWSVQ